MAKSDEILKKVVTLCTDMKYTRDHLKEINGKLEDYPVYKERVDKNVDTLKVILPAVTNLKIKIYGVATAIGIVSGFMGVLIGKFL